MQEGLDWYTDVAPAAARGELMALLQARLPQDQWRNALGPTQATLLHYAAREDDVDALVALLRFGLPVDAVNSGQFTPLLWAAVSGATDAVRVLLAGGASVHARDEDGGTALRWAIMENNPEVVRLLLANGARLADVEPSATVVLEDAEPPVTAALPWMVQLEKGRRCCRAIVVALLGLKRRRGRTFQGWDRFLVREVALIVWSTRQHASWSAGE